MGKKNKKRANEATTVVVSNDADGEERTDEKESLVASPEEDVEQNQPVSSHGADVARRLADDDDDDSSEEDDEEDDDLVLEGVLIRNPDVPSSSSDDDDDEISSESEDDQEEKKKMAIGANQPQNSNKRKSSSSHTKEGVDADNSAVDVGQKKTKSKKKKSKKAEPEIVQVDFTFCDMDEKYFHGLKTHLASSSTIYASHSSAFSNLMIENISVGTVISTQDDGNEGNVYGFASVLNVTTYQTHPCIQYLKQLCLKHCPSDRKEEMETVLSGGTRRPAGFLLHGRMINLPLEITQVLHEQLVLDMDWAVKHAEGSEEERKSLDFGVFVRLAPTYPPDGGAGPVYKYFDDEVFATNAEFVYTFDAPKAYGTDEKQLCSVIVMTKTGHRAAMKDLEKLVNKR